MSSFRVRHVNIAMVLSRHDRGTRANLSEPDGSLRRAVLGGQHKRRLGPHHFGKTEGDVETGRDR